ncbi:hypothetical protein BGX31_005743 [Mortierella sp. GBA43]|nr:hypothetical protein BGX31_005743 [Mortierella sp. GBA43]
MSPASPISAAALPGQSSTSTASRMSISNVINVEDEISSRPIRSLPKVPPSQRGATRSGDVSDADTQTPGEQQDDGDEGSIDDENELDNRPYVQQDLKELEAIQLKGPGTHELHTRNLVGQLHTNGQVANDLENDKPQIWFAFSILSIRTEGYFRIRFCLTDVSRIHEGTGGSSETICEVLSDVIHVQTPKKFEGTCDNSKLAVHLNKNGIRIPARKDDKKERKKKAGMASPTSSLD